MANSNSGSFLELTTTENTTVWIKRDLVSAIEEVPGTSRSEGYVSVYAGGYKFNIKDTDVKEVLSKVNN